MSMEHGTKINCPECGTEGDFIIWQSLNTQLDPDAKEKLISGELFRYTCPKCGRVTNVAYDILYHQMEDLIMIQLAGRDEDVESAVASFDRMKDGSMPGGAAMFDAGYTLRIVRDQNQLREKAYIFDQGLDDRAIEILKLYLRTNLKIQQPELNVAEMLLEINDGAPEQFAVRLEDGTWGSMAFQREAYDKILERLAESEDDGKNAYFVDQDWAMAQLSSGASE